LYFAPYFLREDYHPGIGAWLDDQMVEEDVWDIRLAVSHDLPKKLKPRIAHLMLFKSEPERGIPSK
jgi:hypothetical protein